MFSSFYSFLLIIIKSFSLPHFLKYLSKNDNGNYILRFPFYICLFYVCVYFHLYAIVHICKSEDKVALFFSFHQVGLQTHVVRPGDKCFDPLSPSHQPEFLCHVKLVFTKKETKIKLLYFFISAKFIDIIATNEQIFFITLSFVYEVVFSRL